MKPLLLSAVMALAQPAEEQAAALGETRVDELASIWMRSHGTTNPNRSERL